MRPRNSRTAVRECVSASVRESAGTESIPELSRQRTRSITRYIRAPGARRTGGDEALRRHRGPVRVAARQPVARDVQLAGGAHRHGLEMPRPARTPRVRHRAADQHPVRAARNQMVRRSRWCLPWARTGCRPSPPSPARRAPRQRGRQRLAAAGSASARTPAMPAARAAAPPRALVHHAGRRRPAPAPALASSSAFSHQHQRRRRQAERGRRSPRRRRRSRWTWRQSTDERSSSVTFSRSQRSRTTTEACADVTPLGRPVEPEV